MSHSNSLTLPDGNHEFNPSKMHAPTVKKDPQLKRLESHNSPSVKLNDGKRYSMLVRIDKSSVNYFILSFLPLLQIVRMGRLNKRFYHCFVPVTLGTITIDGTIPSSNKSQFVFALRFEQSPNLSMLVIPRSRNDSSY